MFQADPLQAMRLESFIKTKLSLLFKYSFKMPTEFYYIIFDIIKENTEYSYFCKGKIDACIVKLQDKHMIIADCR